MGGILHMSREVFSINQRWLYSKGFHPSYMRKKCDESDFVEVTLPHTNQIVPLSGFDDKIYQFISSYRRHFQLPSEYREKRVYVDFDSAMTAAEVYINGNLLGEHKGGYTPFRFDLTDYIHWGTDNVLTVKLDSRERNDIPPFGGQMDFLAFGGIYRDVRLRIVNDIFIENVFIKPRNVAGLDRRLEICCFFHNTPERECNAVLSAEIEKDGKVLYSAEKESFIAAVSSPEDTITIENPKRLELWDIEHPVLYTAKIRVFEKGCELDCYTARFGFRECGFTPEGFRLNGQIVPIRGLNRHQSFPWVGYAMPKRVQRRDADILKYELKVNMTRAHYPHSPHFLNRCDEIGLLVFEEIPGWQHIGDESWQELSCENLKTMIQRDFNHPSIILWGVRVNESADNDKFYTRTNEIAHKLDDTRQTSGVRYLQDSKLLEDVFAFNDFNVDRLREPNHPLYLITEFCGHMYPTKHFDNVERITEHTRIHAHVLSQTAAKKGIAGAIGWCAFDYNTHGDFGSGDRICYHGVADIFRIPKFAAGVYKAQCSPEEEVVLEPALAWSIGDKPGGGGVGRAIINSNCDLLKIYLGDEFVTELLPDRENYPGLAHPPFFLNEKFDSVWGGKWKPLRIEGLINGKQVISRTLSERGVDADFIIRADDDELLGDGSDATRVWFMVVDKYGNHKNFATGTIQFEIEGPGEIVGYNPFPLIGGCGAIWVKSKIATGTISLVATHSWLGTKTIEIRVPDEIREPI